jgi:3-oxoacyl-ACP reductase-like protein
MIFAILAAALMDAQPAAATKAPSATAVAAPAAPAAKAVGAEDDDKVVCKSEQVTGTRFSHRTCHTLHEWAQIEKDARDALMDEQSQSYRNPSNGH